MPYAIFDLDLSREFTDIRIPENHSGVALIVRRDSVPVGFVMTELKGERILSAQTISGLIRDRIPAGPPPVDAALEIPRSLDSPSLTIAICTRNRQQDLANCLRSLQQLIENHAGHEIDVMVIDNASSDGRTREVVRSHPGFQYEWEGAIGLDFARNRALREASGDFVAFLDDDVVVDSGWLAGFHHAIRRHPDAAAVTGLVLPAELQTDAQILFEKRGGFQKNFQAIRYGSTLPGHRSYPCVGGRFGTGCDMAIRRDVLLELGGFDEALDAGVSLPGGGDTDMFYRIIRAGYPLVYEPRFLVFHRHRREMNELKMQFARSWGLGLMAYVSKTYGYDHSQRANLRRLVRSWFKNELQLLASRLRGRNELPVDMVLAEIWGGIVGLTGAYGRSRRRVRRIPRAVPSIPLRADACP